MGAVCSLLSGNVTSTKEKQAGAREAPERHTSCIYLAHVQKEGGFRMKVAGCFDDEED
ncbi:MAG: hypothetical protein ABSC19_16625 [Syntrophorhabdales bacterium]